MMTGNIEQVVSVLSLVLLALRSSFSSSEVMGMLTAVSWGYVSWGYDLHRRKSPNMLLDTQ